MAIPATVSAREMQVLHLVSWGFTNKDIAARLNISVKTIEAHKSNGMRKLRLSERSQLIRYAVAEGWLSPAKDPSQVSEDPPGPSMEHAAESH